MVIRRALSIVVVLASLSACGTPSYVDKGQGESGWLGVNEVIFQVSAAYKSSPPDCVALLPLTVKMPSERPATAEDAAKVRTSLYAHLSTQSKRVVRLERTDHVLTQVKDDRKALAEELKCNALIEGQVTEYGSTFYGLYSRVAVGLDLKMVRASDGMILWEASHTAANHGGSIPLDPVGVGMGVADAVGNYVRDEQILRVTDDLTRRLVSTIPDNKVEALEDPVDEVSLPVKLNPVPEDDLSRAENLLNQGDYAGALAAAERAVTSSSDPAKAWFIKGRVLLLVKDYPNAEPAIVKAVALDRGNTSYLNALGAVSAEQGKLDRALAAYHMALNFDPADGFAWYNTAIIQFNTGNVSEAADGFYAAAMAYVKMGDPIKAERALTELQELGNTGLSVQSKVQTIKDALDDISRRKT